MLLAVKGLSRYWGYLELAFILTAWWTTEIGPLALSILTVIVLGYFLFCAPVWCAAQNRDGTSCRRNAP